MKRPDDFERYFQHKKRRPLGDVTNASNTAPLRNKDKAAAPSAARLRNQNNDPHPTKLAVPRLNAAAAASKKGVPLLLVGHLIRSQKLRVSKLLDEPLDPAANRVLVSKISASFAGSTRLGSERATRITLHQALLHSLVDYNLATEQSNAAVRAFCDSVRLHNSRTSASGLGPVVIASVTHHSPLLAAVTTTAGDRFLVMNHHCTPLEPGNTLWLRDHVLHVGSDKIYSDWKLLA